MGRRVIDLLKSQDETAPHHAVVAAVLVRPGREEAAQKILGAEHQALVCTEVPQFVAAADVVLDFSAPAQAARLAPAAALAQKPYVVASTGLDEAAQVALDRAAERCAVLQAANLSLGVQVLIELVNQAASALPEWDVEVVEMHHRRKVDGPSGTALALGQAAQEARPHLQPLVGRSDQPLGRKPSDLGYSVVRGGDVPGEHTVFFFGASERLELCHRSQSPTIFAQGAVVACGRLALATPGRYTMRTLPQRRR